MKEYDVFVMDDSGRLQAFNGGQFSCYAQDGDLFTNLASLMRQITERYERVMELRYTGPERGTGRPTYQIKTVPAVSPARA